ncbi:TetR/AcrR family transcriptional regulator [Saccharibacillus sp. JS10]|uniref:TetR/AcrR family transcriptional regulator n=1 Tax=Saccharibacillus sp. JS10 TaxID=2950552 RepID=UPI0021093E23|nr:TetR/AcrR family transcriptional regulator [Saccharibacillus sp. JS10]MCQ4086718.1 TetR/AcrR family transcriptional regulator [Saccharibacillus sp. JS10]
MDEVQKDSNRDKMMRAAIDLIASRGYKSVTTLEIAAASGLSEKTLFRNFGSKQNLLEAAFERFHYKQEMSRIFNEQLVGELHADLMLISRNYHEIMNRNRKMIMIGIKEAENLPGFSKKTSEHPRQLVAFLTDYFKKMDAEKKMIKANAEIQAFSFISMNYGVFLSNLVEDTYFPDVPLDAVIEESVRIFVRALTP